ncbi:hypothetical protein C1645_739750 [Glomus cerebriforme]|uniref:HMG box domain-containing protein n=1 Tax=Glomus cerebriforme TaxID=658196 RepID=A0A397SYW1_9GLOM|nr:hypothetical protein C1645_739750 [Glomus cerebriforme]
MPKSFRVKHYKRPQPSNRKATGFLLFRQEFGKKNKYKTQHKLSTAASRAWTRLPEKEKNSYLNRYEKSNHSFLRRTATTSKPQLEHMDVIDTNPNDSGND